MPQQRIIHVRGWQGMNRRAPLAQQDAPTSRDPKPCPMFDLVNVDVSRLPEVLTPRPNWKPIREYGAASIIEPIGEA